jgi:hypothetical protein
MSAMAPPGHAPSLHSQNKTVGYLCVGGIFIAAGATLLGLGAHLYPYDYDVSTPQEVRRVLMRDRRRDSFTNAGIAIITTGALIFFGFGITELAAGLATARATRPK